MKIIKITLLVFVFVFTSCKKGVEFVKTPIIKSEIDDLRTKAEVENFIQKSDTNYKKYELKHLQDFNRAHDNDSVNKILANKLNAKTYYTKVDLDNNGYTDLLAIGDNHTCFGDGGKSCSFSPIIIMNYGKNNTKIFNVDLEWEQALVPKVEYINSQPFLVIYKEKLIDWKKKTYVETRTVLTFKFGSLIEYNENPSKNKITKIEFNTSGCYGTCPVYKLTLNKDSLSIFNAKYFNFKDVFDGEEGVFSVMINKKDFNELEEYLNYCDFENLKKEYAVMRTDDQTGDLKITFNNGKIKTISDYGMVGTYGLNAFYEKLSQLRFNQKWKKK